MALFSPDGLLSIQEATHDVVPNAHVISEVPCGEVEVTTRLSWGEKGGKCRGAWSIVWGPI
jgi:hypothetical protein